jgi:hypothetical protein
MCTLRDGIIDTINWSGWPGVKHPKLLFGRCSAILTEVFRGFTQFLQKNAETVSRLVHGRFLQNPFQFIIQIHESSYHSVIQCYIISTRGPPAVLWNSREQIPLMKKKKGSILIIIFWEMTPCGSYKNHLPEDDNHHSHRRGNLKSYRKYIV